MNTKQLVVTPDNELQEITQQPVIQQPGWLKRLADIISYIFHPVFVPVYVVYFLLFIAPFLFVGFAKQQKVMMLAHAILMYTFFPLITVLLLKALNFISSVRLKTQKDRIIPFIASGIWYFWVWYVWRNMPQYPREAVVFAMAVFLASSIGLICNTYIKISMHAIAIGTALTFLCLLAMNYAVNLSAYLSIAFLIGGMVGTSRLILAEHSTKEVYLGLATGVAAVMMANFFM